MSDTSQLTVLVERLVAALAPERVFLFGSHAWGVPGVDSDIDLMVIVPESDLPQYKRAQRAYRAIRGVDVPTDILVLTRDEFERQTQVVSSLARQVREHGKSLYERRHGEQARASGLPSALGRTVVT
jgi:predicted nucleotidyltransferase